MLTILHSGDIHLDSPFSGLNEHQAQERRAELRESFLSMLTYAQKNHVDLVLIAGDLFDREFATRETAAALAQGFGQLSCPVVISPGNHDYFSPDSIWMKTVFPENVYLFRSPEVTKISFDALNTDVYGFAFNAPSMTESPLRTKKADDPTRINILLAHGDLGAPASRYCPLSRAELVEFGADYAALGHIHTPGPLENRSGTVIAYSGCLEGRSPDEPGPKGAILAQIEKEGTTARVRAGRLRFSRRRYEKETIDVTDAQTLFAVEECIRRVIAEKKYGEDTLLYASLSGSVPPSLIIDTEALAGRFPQLYRIRLTDETTPALHPADYANDRTARGWFYRTMAEKIENGDSRERQVASLALRYGLAAIAGEDVSDQ